jgi:CheY-like chemotaxis protein
MARETTRILIVDDNPANCKLLSFILTHHGYAVRLAIDAVEAVAAIRSEPPHLILMDLQLPGKDGLTLTRELKADPATASIFVVAITAFAMKGDSDLALAAGCDAYISKPIDTRTFPGQIAAFLGHGAVT